MTSRDFVYWLQGFFEISSTDEVTPAQVRVIRNHLNLVFKHEIDPSIDNNDPKLKVELQNIHDGLTGGTNSVGGKLIRC